MSPLIDPRMTEQSMTRFVRDCTLILIGILLGAATVVIGISLGMGIF